VPEQKWFDNQRFKLLYLYDGTVAAQYLDDAAIGRTALVRLN